MMKRSFDIVIAVIAIVIFAPLALIIAPREDFRLNTRADDRIQNYIT